MSSVLAAIVFHDERSSGGSMATAGEWPSVRIAAGRGATARPQGFWQWTWFGLKAIAHVIGELMMAGLQAGVFIWVGSRLLNRFAERERSGADVLLFPVEEHA